MTSRLDPEHQQAVLQLIRESARAETEAQGADRRRAFRTTRHLLTAAIALGIPAATIAAELGVQTGSVRTRAHLQGPISRTDFAALTGLPLNRIRSWDLPPSPEEPDAHSATGLLQALLHDVTPADAG